jgi:hypothetical protein
MVKKVLWFLTLAIIITSCSQRDRKQLIVKKWRLVYTSAPISDSAKNVMYEKYLTQFTEDNKYLVGFDSLLEVGTYNLTNDRQKLNVTFNSTGETEDVQIIKLTADTLKTKIESNGIETVFVPAK